MNLPGFERLPAGEAGMEFLELLKRFYGFAEGTSENFWHRLSLGVHEELRRTRGRAPA
jgi:hypothetical protein